jgi:EAL domain-containing protein (putative c-di-GMP-specific phosphodiesterase class I)
LLQNLHRLGVGLSIDDFGTGYSSLAYLKRFPVQSIKIDKSFVRDLTVDADDAAIVSAVVAMAKSLKLKVVAEGVETKEQLDYLTTLYCNEYQGYYFSRPVPAATFVRYLEQQRQSATA